MNIKELFIKLGAKVDPKGFKKFDDLTEKTRKKAESQAKSMYDKINSLQEKSNKKRSDSDKKLIDKQMKAQEKRTEWELRLRAKIASMQDKESSKKQRQAEQEYNRTWRQAEREQKIREQALRYEQTVRKQIEQMREREAQRELQRIERQKREAIKAQREQVREEQRIRNDRLTKAYFMESTGDKMKNVGDRGMTLFGAGILGTAKTAGDIQAVSNQVKAFGGYTDKDMPLVGQLAKSISVSSAFNQLELLTGMKELGKAGYKKDDLKHLMTILPNFATASDTTFDQGAVLLTDQLSTFGYKVAEAGKVSDILTTALNESKLNFDDFSYSLKYSAAPAKAAGVKLEKLAAFLAIMSQSGIKGSTAGTGLRTMFVNLSSEQESINKNSKRKEKQKATLSDLGIKGVFDKNDNLDLTKVILELGSKFKGMKKGKQLSILRDLVGKTAMNQMFLLIDAFKDENKRQMAMNIDNKITSGHAGNTNKVATVINQGYNFDKKQFENSMMSLQNEVGKSFLPVLTKITQGITAFFNKISETNPYILKFGAALMVGGFAISALISAIGTLLISIASIRIAMIVLRGTFITTYASMLLPIAAAVAIGVALGFLLKYLYNWFGGWEGIWNSVKGIIGSVADTIKSALGGAIDWVTSKFSGFGNWVSSIFSGLGSKFSNFTSQMSGFKPPSFNFSPNFAGSTGGGKSVVLNNQSPVNVNMYGSKASPANVASAVSNSQSTNMNSFFNNMNNSFLR